MAITPEVVDQVGATLLKKSALRIARVRLDVSAMLCRREKFARQAGTLFRYLARGASPQTGMEVFKALERVHAVDVRSGVPVVEERCLPLVTLGHGRLSLADKVQAHVRQTWLEYGPSLKSLARANAAVRQCLTGMGTEYGVAGAPDVTPACAHS